MAEKNKSRDCYFVKDRTVIPMTAHSLTPSYPLELYEGQNPTPINLAMFKLTLAAPAVGSGIRKADLVNPDAPPGTGVPMIEVFVAVRKDADGVRTVFWNGDRQSSNQMFVSMKGGRAVLRGSLFRELAADLGLDLSKQGDAKGIDGKPLKIVYVRAGYSPGQGTSYAPKNTYRGHAKERSYFDDEEIKTMSALASAEDKSSEPDSLDADTVDESDADKPKTEADGSRVTGGVFMFDDDQDSVEGDEVQTVKTPPKGRGKAAKTKTDKPGSKAKTGRAKK